jgi:hypothetical protein
MVRLEVLGQLKNPITSSGIEPATFRLVARRHVSKSRIEDAVCMTLSVLDYTAFNGEMIGNDFQGSGGGQSRF